MNLTSTLPPSVRRQPVGLTSLAVGAEARFHGTSLARADLDILEALGLTGACRLRVCQAGDPWIVQVRSTRIGIADAVARAILVVPESVAEGDVPEGDVPAQDGIPAQPGIPGQGRP